MREQLEAEISALDHESIQLVGGLPKSEVIAAMHQARFLVFPSGWFEGFPMTLVEAFACGLAIIASRLGSMAEIVTDGVTGLQFTPGDANDLADKVIWAWSHPAEMQEMGNAGRREYETKYTPERNLEMLLNIYREAMNTSIMPAAHEAAISEV